MCSGPYPRRAPRRPARGSAGGLATFLHADSWRAELPASATLVAFSVPASMTLPVQLNFPTPLRGSANAALNYTAGTTSSNILLTVTGFNSY